MTVGTHEDYIPKARRNMGQDSGASTCLHFRGAMRNDHLQENEQESFSSDCLYSVLISQMTRDQLWPLL